MQHRKQRRVYEQGLRIAYELGDDLSPQEFQEAPELPHPTVKRGRVKSHHAREQVRKESLGIAQEGALRLHAPQLLEKRQGDNLRVREPLEGLVASSAVGVEQRVSIVHDAEEDSQSLFREGEPSGMVGVGHLLLLREGRLWMAPFYLMPNPRNTHLGLRCTIL